MTDPYDLRRRIREIRYERPTLYRKQESILFADARYAYCEASTKAGKTHGCIVWLVEQAVLHGAPGRNFWWVAPVRAQAEIAFRRIKNSLPKSMFRANESDLYIELPNLARIWFKSAEKPDNLYGEDVYAAVLDEASRCRFDSWVALRSTLTATRGPVRLIGNVKGKSNWFYLECRAIERGRPDAVFGRISCWDAVEAGILDKEEVEDARRVLPAKEFSELYEAMAQDDEDAFIPSVDIQAAVNRKDIIESGPLIIGADPSQGGDPAAFCFRRGPVVLRIEEHKGMDEIGFIAYALRILEEHKPAAFFMDGTGFGTTIAKQLWEKGHKNVVKSFHMAERSTYPDEYYNKRAECWGEGRKWLQDISDPAKLPDDDGFVIELGCIRNKPNTRGKLLLEDKADLKARGYDSPNKGDAWALTFAEPVSFTRTTKINYPDHLKHRSIA